VKTFDESAVTIDVLKSPVTWVMAMHEATGAAMEDLEDYARRRGLWEDISQWCGSDHAVVPPSVLNALKYRLGMEHLS
jgi:hypothetical protein